MKAQIYNIKAEQIGELTLPKAIFDQKVSDQLINQAVRVYLANQRSSYAKTKTRSEVAATRKKVWRQKGTGNARHGNRTAPIFVGGGVALGPDGQQNYSLKLNKKMRHLALNGVLSRFAKENRIIIIDKINKITPKTKEGIKFITGLKGVSKVLSESKKIGIVTTKSLINTKRAFRNIPKTTLMSLKSLNVYDLLNQNFLILSQKTIKNLTK